MTKAEELIEIVEVSRPDAVRLARVVSLAVRIESHLLRRARLALAPGCPASAEAELWFSPMVSSSGASAIVLRPSVAQVLRQQLAEDARLFERAHLLVERAHAGAAPTLRLEEEAIWSALSAGPTAANKELARALATMLEQPERARGVARWALRAVPALPADVRDTDAARFLQAGAEWRTSRSSRGLADVPSGVAPLLMDDPGQRARIGVRLLRGGLEVSEPPAPGAHALEIPDTVPLILKVRLEGASARPATVEIQRRSVTSLGVDGAAERNPLELEVATVDGDVYRLRQELRTRARVAMPGTLREYEPGDRRVSDADMSEPIEVSVYLRGSASLDWVDKEATRPPGRRRTLTRAEFSESYGASERDIAAVRSFAEAYGLDVASTDRSRRWISLHGRLGGFAEAFGVAEVGRFRDAPRRRAYRARRGSLSVPAELDGVIVGVFGIDGRNSMDPNASESPEGSRAGGYSPAEIAALYDFPNSYTGNGQTIGIIELGGRYSLSDLESYFASFGLTPPVVSLVSVGDSSNASGVQRSADEGAMFNAQVVGMVVPSARIAVYFAPNSERGFIDAVSTAVHDSVNEPSVISISWGWPEETWTQQAIAEMDQILVEAAALGVTVTAAAGDRGSSDGVHDGRQHVLFPACAPHALACGGTSLVVDKSRIDRETVWNALPDAGATGGGISTRFGVPAYQDGVVIPPNIDTGMAGRGVPDVAGAADPRSGYQIRLHGTDMVVGGTSFVAPLWAALIARLNEALGAPIGFFQPLLYRDPLRSTLRDITVGDNGAYKAGPGWDACTGLGSPDGTALLRALEGLGPPDIPRRAVTAQSESGGAADNLARVVPAMFGLMLQNVASDDRLFSDPWSPNTVSRPGCIVAAMSRSPDDAEITQNFVYNWTRDAAIVGYELAMAAMPGRTDAASRSLVDYVIFAQLCQSNARPTLGHACFTIEGLARPWTEQNDGPALQTLTLLQALPSLDEATRTIAAQMIQTNVEYLLAVYQEPTTNLWEEHSGQTLFARSVQLRCFRELLSNTVDIVVPPDARDAVSWLESALQSHWNGTHYVSVLPTVPSYDPNIDVVMASVYGAIGFTDTRALATAAQIRRLWADPASPVSYPINAADRSLGLGPLVGRYPGDVYDGSSSSRTSGGHPWTLCTCNLAEFYYGVARAITGTGNLPYDDLSAAFFEQIGIGPDASTVEAVAALREAGDAILRAVLYHSDGFTLSEQSDAQTGYLRGVSNMTWSYAAFISAVRARLLIR